MECTEQLTQSKRSSKVKFYGSVFFHAGEDRGREEKGATEDEMVGRHH